MEYDIFLSYSREDVSMMQRVRDDLRADGFMVWTDEGIEPGTPSWKVAIEEALLNTQCVVVLLSPSASQSKWVRNELDFAETHRKRIFPMMVRGDEEQSVPFGYTSYQWIDIREKRQFEEGLSRLKDSLRKAQAKPPPDAPTTHQLAESTTKRRLSIPLMIGVGIIAIILVSAVLYLVTKPNFASNLPDTTATPELTQELAATDITDEIIVEATDIVEAPTGWKWVESPSAHFMVPVDWVPMNADDYFSIGLQIPEFETVNIEALQAFVPQDEFSGYVNWLTISGVIFAVDDFGVTLPINAVESRYRTLFDENDFEVDRIEQVQIPQGAALRVQFSTSFGTDNIYQQISYIFPLNNRIYLFGVGGLMPEEELATLLDAMLATLQIVDAEPLEIALPPEATEYLEIRDGWKLVQTQRSTLEIPITWLGGDVESPSFQSSFQIIFGDRQIETLMSPTADLDTIIGTITRDGVIGAAILYDVSNLGFSPPEEFIVSVAQAYLVEYATVLTSDTITLPAGEAYRIRANILNDDPTAPTWQLLGYLVIQDDSTSDSISFIYLADSYDLMRPTIEEIMQTWRFDD